MVEDLHSRHGQVCTQVKEPGCVCQVQVMAVGGFLSVVSALKVKFSPQEVILSFLVFRSMCPFSEWVSVVSAMQHLKTACVKQLGPARYNRQGCHLQTISQTAIL